MAPTAIALLVALGVRSYLAPTSLLDAAAGGVAAWNDGNGNWTDSLPSSAQYLDQKSFNALGTVGVPSERNGSNVCLSIALCWIQKGRSFAYSLTDSMREGNQR